MDAAKFSNVRMAVFIQQKFGHMFVKPELGALSELCSILACCCSNLNELESLDLSSLVLFKCAD